ncbi:MAG: hypothetical protein FJ271_08815 [Planctomycetes bacterium]|nr:hypothetical protein [Planctomycetota bacterium]
MRFIVVAVTLLVLHGTAPAQQKDLVAKGKIELASHTYKMNVGSLYHVKVEGKGFQPYALIQSGFLPFFAAGNAAERNTFQSYYAPKESKEYRILIMPNLFGAGELPAGPLDYTLSVKPIALGKAIVKAEGKWTDDDPLYTARFPFGNQERKTHFKAYPLKMKAGNLYVIDLIRNNEQNTDPYLFLEGPDGKVVTQDDDGDGNLNSRIIFPAKQDGNYRVIATTLSPATGDFTLTVRAGTTGKHAE